MRQQCGSRRRLRHEAVAAGETFDPLGARPAGEAGPLPEGSFIDSEARLGSRVSPVDDGGALSPWRGRCGVRIRQISLHGDLLEDEVVSRSRPPEHLGIAETLADDPDRGRGRSLELRLDPGELHGPDVLPARPDHRGDRDHTSFVGAGDPHRCAATQLAGEQRLEASRHPRTEVRAFEPVDIHRERPARGVRMLSLRDRQDPRQFGRGV
jgi:hypothetical protein